MNCETCINFERAKSEKEEIPGCDLNDMTRFAVNSHMWDPVGVWCLTHPKSHLLHKKNPDARCSAYTSAEMVEVESNAI